MASTNPPAAIARRAALLNTAIVAAGYLVSRILGLLREVIIANQFGTSPELSAFRAAFTIPDLVYLVVAGGALGSAFIPVFAGFLTEGREHDAWRLFSTIFNFMCVLVLVVATVIVLFAEPLVALTVGSGFSPELRALTATFVRLLMVQVFLLGIVGLGKATLESFDRFSLPVIGSLVYNLGIILGALLLTPRMGIYGLVAGVIIGAALFALVELPGLFAAGMRYMPEFRLDVPGVGQVAALIGPRLFGQAALQLNIIALASFASQVGPTAPAANSVAYQLMLLPHGLIALSLGTVLFPQLSRLFSAGDTAAARAVAISGLRNILFLALPAAVALSLLRQPLIELLFQHGKFAADSTGLSAEALLFYALGLPAFAASEIAVRTFYAMRDTRTPVVVGIGAMLLNIALGWLGIRSGLGLGGLALAFSIANIAECLVLVLVLRRRLAGLDGLGSGLLRMLLAAALFGAIIEVLRRLSVTLLPFLSTATTFVWSRDSIALTLWLAATTAIAGAAYLGFATLLRLPETAVVAQVRRRLGRR